jgi:hypothetical protein
VKAFTRLSLDFHGHDAQKYQKRGEQAQASQEALMPAYEICYLDDGGALTYRFSATCDNDQRAKILAHAMKLPSMKRLQVWSGEALIYSRPDGEGKSAQNGPPAGARRAVPASRPANPHPANPQQTRRAG